MKFTGAAVIAAAISGAAAWGNVTYTTEVVTAYTTYCPEATEITQGSSTYTVTEATTLTISNCPCTLTHPVTVSSYVACSTSCSAPVYANSTLASSPVSTTPVGTGAGAPTAPPNTVPTAGAGKAAALSGAGLAGLVGLAAFVL